MAAKTSGRKRTASKTKKSVANRFFNRVVSSKPLTALLVMVVFAAVGGSYLLLTKAATVTTLGIAAFPDHSGYYLAQDNGVVQKCAASNPSPYVNKCYTITSPISGVTIVGIAATATGNGFWQLQDNGHVINRGDAVNYGDPPLGAGAYSAIVATTTGHGYWVVTKAGQIISKGDAIGKVDTNVRNFSRDSGGAITNLGSAHIVSVADNNADTGLFMLGTDGKVWTVGSGARNAGNATLSSGESATAIYSDYGWTSYLITTNKGGVDAFNYPFAGSEYGKTSEPIVGIQAYHDSAGGHYWLLGQYGGVFTFGTNTQFHGSAYIGTSPAPSPTPTPAPAPAPSPTPTPAPSPTPAPTGTNNGDKTTCQSQVIHSGASGSCIDFIHYGLVYGYGVKTLTPSDISGHIYGANSVAAVKAVQSRTCASVDGVVGPQTWKLLLDSSTSYCASPPPPSSGQKNQSWWPECQEAMNDFNAIQYGFNVNFAAMQALSQDDSASHIPSSVWLHDADQENIYMSLTTNAMTALINFGHLTNNPAQRAVNCSSAPDMTGVRINWTAGRRNVNSTVQYLQDWADKNRAWKIANNKSFNNKR